MTTASEFERAYAARSGITVDKLRTIGRVVIPCECDSDDCEKWQSLSRENAIDELKFRPHLLERPGSVCSECRGWVDPDAPRQIEAIYNPDLMAGRPVILKDGVELARYRVRHNYCVRAGLLSVGGEMAGQTESTDDH